MADMARVWGIVIQCGFGAVLCGVGVWAGIRSGYLDLKHPDDRRLLWIFAGGFFGLLLFFCVFTFLAPNWPAEASAARGANP